MRRKVRGETASQQVSEPAGGAMQQGREGAISFQLPLLAQNTQASGGLVVGQLVAAIGAEQIRGANGAEAGAAVGRELVVALGAEVKIALDVSAARGAA